MDSLTNSSGDIDDSGVNSDIVVNFIKDYKFITLGYIPLFSRSMSSLSNVYDV